VVICENRLMKLAIWALIGIVCLLVAFGVSRALQKTEPSGPLIADLTRLTQPTTADAVDATQDTLSQSVLRDQDAMQAKHIAIVCWEWSRMHNNQLPDDLATMVVAGVLTPSDLVVERTGTTPLPWTKDMAITTTKDLQSFVHDLDDHCDFIYLGKGIGGPQLDENEITQNVALLYDKPNPKLSHRINIAYIDGHVSSYRLDQLATAFAATDALRAKSNLRPIDITAFKTPPTP
jgi:prepilin-type processing-associated H-X9-DG protein